MDPKRGGIIFIVDIKNVGQDHANSTSTVLQTLPDPSPYVEH